MKKIYIVERTTCGGSIERTKTFTNKREAKSFAFHWINSKKEEHRSICGDRSYGELVAYVYGANDYGDCIGEQFFVGVYS
jgi:hypothetical protein